MLAGCRNTPPCLGTLQQARRAKFPARAKILKKLTQKHGENEKAAVATLMSQLGYSVS